MINFQAVSDAVFLDDVRYILAAEVNLVIPPGRYALLIEEPALPRYALNLLAGIRIPEKGTVACRGLRSWPIGRAGVVRDKLAGSHIVAMIARLYELDPAMCETIMRAVMTYPDELTNLISDWTRQVRREFIYSLTLLPKFSVYLVEGPLPSQASKFSRVWGPLFGERILGQTLIMSGLVPSEFKKYCDQAIVFDEGRIFVEQDLEKALSRYAAASPSPINIEEEEVEESADEEDLPL